MRRTPARLLLAGSLVLSGGAVVLGASLPWLTTFAGLQGFPAIDGLFGQVLAGLGGAVAVGGLVLAWRETTVGRWALLGCALVAALLSGWMLAQAEGLYATLAADPFTVAARGPGGFVALAAALLSTGLALVPVPGSSPEATPSGTDPVDEGAAGAVVDRSRPARGR